MENNLLKRYAVEYFKKFRDKDLGGLSDLYADNIILKDWNGMWAGKEDVLNINADFFNCDFTIKINSIDVSIPRANINFDLTIGDTTTNVDDSIFFNNEYKITNITAYLNDNGTNQ